MKLSTITLGFIGFGNMATALWEGLAKKSALDPAQVMFCTRSLESQKTISLKYGLVPVSLETLVEKCQLIILAVKPQTVASVIQHFPKEVLDVNQLVISIAAGIPLSYFRQELGAHQPCVRAMPNMPSCLGEGVCGLSFNESVTPPFHQLVTSLFGYCGQVLEVPESALSAVTAISGSGPAFFYKLADAIAQEGAKNGLPYPQALKAAAQTLVGAGKMLLESDHSPQALIQSVASTKGTTAAALATMDRTNMDQLIQEVVRSAIERAKTLAQEVAL